MQITGLFAYQWDYWNLGHKITVDYIERLIYVNGDVDTLDIKIDVYSDLKELWMLDNTAHKYGRFEFPIRAIGGDEIGDGAFLGDIFFLTNGWRIVYDPTVVRKVNGSLYSDDFDTAWLYSGDLKPIYPIKAADVVQYLNTEQLANAYPTADEIAQAVWATGMNELTTPDSTGQWMRDKVLTVKKFLGLSVS